MASQRPANPFKPLSFRWCSMSIQSTDALLASVTGVGVGGSPHGTSFMSH